RALAARAGAEVDAPAPGLEQPAVRRAAAARPGPRAAGAGRARGAGGAAGRGPPARRAGTLRPARTAPAPAAGPDAAGLPAVGGIGPGPAQHRGLADPRAARGGAPGAAPCRPRVS